MSAQRNRNMNFDTRYYCLDHVMLALRPILSDHETAASIRSYAQNAGVACTP